MRLAARALFWIGVFCATVLLYAVTGRAASMAEFRALPIKQQCDWETQQFLGAVEAREKNHERQIFSITTEELQAKIESGEIPTDMYGRVMMPKDGMYVQNYDTMDDEAKAFVDGIIYLGWDMADAWIAASIKAERQKDPEYTGQLNAAIAPKTKNEWATRFYTECLRKTAEESRI